MFNGFKYKIKQVDRGDIGNLAEIFTRTMHQKKWVNKKMNIVERQSGFNGGSQFGIPIDSSHSNNRSHRGIVTTGQLLNDDRRNIQEQDAKMHGSFDSLQGMLNGLEDLKGILGYMNSAGLSHDKQFLESHKKSEADEILSDLGVVNVYRKDEEGDVFYVKIAQQISEIFSKVLLKKGSVMSLIDVYLYYNRLLGSNLITPDDLLKATRLFPRVNSP